MARRKLAGRSRPDRAGLCAPKFSRLQGRPRKVRKSPNLDENDQLKLNPEEQAELANLRKELGAARTPRTICACWWKERLRAARRVFNDPVQVEKIVEMLEKAGEKG